MEMKLKTYLAIITTLFVHHLLLTFAYTANHTMPDTSSTGFSLRVIASKAINRHSDGFLNVHHSLHVNLQQHPPSLVPNATLISKIDPPQPLQNPHSLALSFGTGNGRQDYILKIDMVNPLTWIQCKKCNPHSTQHNPIFDPEASPTFHHVPGTSPLCAPPYGPVRGGRCAFELRNPSPVWIKGYLSQDHVNNGAMVFPGFIFGCSHYAKNFFNERVYAGIVHLGRAPTSLVMQVADHGLTRFSYCLYAVYGGSKTNRQGFLHFGTNVPHNPHLKTTKILPTLNAHESEYYLSVTGISLGKSKLDRIRPEMFARSKDGQGGCLIDPGTPLTVMVEEAYRIIEEAIWLDLQRHGAERMKRSGFGLCVQATKATKEHLQSLSLHFSEKEAVLEFLPQQLFLMMNDKKGQIACLAMVPGHRTIIGAFQQVDMRFVYDIKESTLSFAPESSHRRRLVPIPNPAKLDRIDRRPSDPWPAREDCRKEEGPERKESASGESSDSNTEVVEWVEMPEDYLRWVLAQTRETDPVPTLDDYNVDSTQDPVKLEQILQQIARLQASQDEFFEFQAWVRDTYEKNGRVMVPADVAGPKDLLQEAMNELWDELMKEYDDKEKASGAEVVVAMPPN
ncbi:hypothetical protein EJB05_03245, partial [Eragrostis curvula]